MRIMFKFDRDRFFAKEVPMAFVEKGQEVLEEYAEYIEHMDDPQTVFPQAPEEEGVLFAWHIPNPPRQQGYWVRVRDVEEAIFVLDLLADIDLFLGDEIWANASGLQVYEDGDWPEWEDRDGYQIEDFRNPDGLRNGYKIVPLGSALKVPPMRFRLVADNLRVAMKAIDFLTSRSASFEFEPAPDGEYWIVFKHEQREALERFMHYEEVPA